MNPLNSFQEYLNEGIVKKATPDIPRAHFLIEESCNSFDGLIERVKKIGINSKNANSIIKDSHDIILEMIRARMLKEGFNASGYRAHEAEVSYMQKLGFSDFDIFFVNELRASRNGITYYGRMFEIDYASKVVSFVKSIYPKLKEICKLK